MKSLSKELITKLARESDIEVIKEVLHYYAFLKEKKEKENKSQWDSIEEVEPDEEELKIISVHENNPGKYEFIRMEELLKEIGIDESEL